MFELKHLRSLKALKETDSLVLAAESLHLSQSALSHQIADLEARIGSPLFLRKTHPIQFTHEGELLVALAEDVLPKIDETTLVLKGEGKRERLTLAVECHSCIRWLTPTLQKVRLQFPELEFDFSSGQEFEPQQALIKGSIDVVLTADILPMDGIYYAPLFDFEMRAVMSPTHPLAQQSTLEPSDFQAETILSYPVEAERLDVIRLFLNPAQVVPKQIKQVDNTLMLTQMVASEWGITVLPDWVCREFEHQALMVSKSLGKGLWRRMYAAVRVGEKSQPEIQALIKALVRS